MDVVREPGWRRQEISAGIAASLSAGLGLFPLGIAFGLLVAQSGLPLWAGPALSIFGYAGSLELLLVGLMATGTPLATIALTTLLVNFRHVFYAFSFPIGAVRHPFAKAYSVYALTDEAYAITASHDGRWTSPRLITLQLALQAYWVGGGLAGLLIGSLMTTPIEGLEFALCALFITLTLDACRKWDQVPSLLLAALSFAVAAVAVPDQALFAAMVLFLLLLAGRFLVAKKRGTIA
ncbi:MAG: AzlC family ABC transporter permease [Microbacterium gubbeenense]|uniref:AzlC family ABC transporter permease n=2 Tax=Actinomycetes TaxID=1760 RepID=UPI000ED47CCD|nr:AzlC family ABC transporter permease [Brevibacterium sp.]HCG57050.1 branched-chain amino acid transporter AzlC [Brevibacterium sp.]